MSRVNTQGIIQQLKHYTSSDFDDQLVLRLHNNKIIEGSYKGSRWGQFKHWCTSPFLSQEARNSREQYLQQVTSEESVALAKALCRDISRRTPVPFDADKSLTVKDIKQVITASKTDRQKFSQIVRDLINCATVPDPLGKAPVQALSERIDQAINDRTIRRTVQIKQLCNEVIDAINKRNISGSEKKQLVNNVNKLLFQKQEFLLLLQEAEVIALGVDLTNTSLLVNTSTTDTLEQDKKALISRATRTLKDRYPSVFPRHNQSREEQLRTYLEKSLSDRSVTVLDKSVIRPLVNNPADFTPPLDRRDSGISVSDTPSLSEDVFLQGIPDAPEFLVSDDDTPLPPPPLEETIEGFSNAGITPPPPPPPPLPTITEGRNNFDSAASDQIQNKIKPKSFKGIKKHSSNLLQAIKKGLKLKKTPEPDQQKQKLEGTAAILSRRIAIAPDEDNDSDTESGYDSEWD